MRFLVKIGTHKSQRHKKKEWGEEETLFGSSVYKSNRFYVSHCILKWQFFFARVKRSSKIRPPLGV